MSSSSKRRSKKYRKTSETEISLSLGLDGKGLGKIKTGIPFFDHMLNLFARHGLMDLDVKAKGDLDVDMHHTVEDVGIVLGQALATALGKKEGIRRYGCAHVPMDETLARVVVDLSGRPYLELRGLNRRGRAGNFPAQLVEEFLRALSVQGGMNLHAEILYGRDVHHQIEAIFKALAKALQEAVSRDPRVKGVPSTKGRI
ncbi:MAG: imidazoleglycerol-phosphate dehydratase HisB [Verrucomicrobia bacterium]|jgi:imidazoleglycerol-phosphate dehydratase|nr:imidazoleglycerol-phosphate dehydratase HisB [Verrucomicrobiota bacterium]NBS86957.1 imidazoleglycerol-phosphate dehydratase HisB [Verrucomicrobiota bacterium]